MKSRLVIIEYASYILWQLFLWQLYLTSEVTVYQALRYY